MSLILRVENVNMHIIIKITKRSIAILEKKMFNHFSYIHVIIYFYDKLRTHILGPYWPVGQGFKYLESTLY